MSTPKRKNKPTKAVRRERLETARQIVGKLKPEVHRVRINDKNAIHITIWVKAGLRIDWWPSTERWRDWNEDTHIGSPEKFVAFVRDAKELPDRIVAKTESLIDEGDEIPVLAPSRRTSGGHRRRGRDGPERFGCLEHLDQVTRSHMAAIRAEVPS